MTHHVLTDRTAQTSVATTLGSWRHALGREAVCLVRLIQPAYQTGAAVVLSEIAENPDALGITSDFPGAATAAWSVLGSHAAGLDPAHLRWFAHHGPFSSYDPAGPETLTEVALTFDGTCFQGDLTGHHLLDTPSTVRLLASWQLEPVDEALARLGRA